MNAADLWAMLAVDDGTRFEVRFREQRPEWDEPGPPEWAVAWIPVAEPARFAGLCELSDCEVSLVPRRSKMTVDVGKSMVMWARLETSAHAEALAKFRPAPTVVLREGSSPRRVALWWSTTPIPEVSLERGNLRLAHALGAKKKWAAPGFMAHPPGTVLRHGRELRPVLVHAEFVSTERYSPARIAGGLKDAPDRNAWRDRAKEAA